MQKEFQLQVSPEVTGNPSDLATAVAKKFGFPGDKIRHIEILRRSIDARKKEVKMNLKILVFVNEDIEKITIFKPDYRDVSAPAGLAFRQGEEVGKEKTIQFSHHLTTLWTG